MKQFNLFIPMTKVDEKTRSVYGLATAESVDKSGEIFDYESSLPYYKEWSGEIAKASGGKSLGNVREMHTNIAAGKLTQIEFNDDKKQIEVCAKIVNDSTWEKVMEGVLTGFSHGGEYIKTWKDPDNSKLTRYTARPSEISVVDNPCLGSATFELVRADGATEMRKFKNQEQPMTETIIDGKPVQPQYKAIQKWEASDGKTFEKKDDWRVYELSLETAAVTNAATAPALNALAELEKALREKEQPAPGSAEDPMTLGKREFTDEQRKKLAESGAALPDGSFPIENTHDLKNAIHAYGRAADKEKAKDHIIARAKALGEESLLPEGWGGEQKKDDNGNAKAAMPKMKKGLDQVARAACMLQEMQYLCNSLIWEANEEKDNSPLPNEFRDLITRMCSFLEALVEEECRELATPHAVELMGAETMEMAAGLPKDAAAAMVKRFAAVQPEGLDEKAIVKVVELKKALDAAAAGDLAKAGARHSAADKRHLAKAAAGIEEASDHLDDAKKHHGNVGKAHEAMRGTHEEMSKAYGAMQDCMKSYGKAEEGKDDGKKEMKENLDKMSGHIDNLDSHLDKAQKHHGKLGKAHEAIAAAHDTAHGALEEVGATAGEDETEKTVHAAMQKAADELTLVKADLSVKETENAELKKALDTINGQVPSLIERLKKLEAQPMPAKGAVFPVSKGHEAKTPAAPVEAPSYSTYGASPAEMREILHLSN